MPASFFSVILSLPSRLTNASVTVFVVDLLPMASLTPLSRLLSCAFMAVGVAKAVTAAMMMRMMFFFILLCCYYEYVSFQLKRCKISYL